MLVAILLVGIPIVGIAFTIFAATGTGHILLPPTKAQRTTAENEGLILVLDLPTGSCGKDPGGPDLAE